VDGSLYLCEFAAAENQSDVLTPATFDALPKEQQDLIALQIFYIVLRDAGRNHTVSGSSGYGNYDAGYAAISALFPGSMAKGDITTQSRSIVTQSGGDISLLAPGGGLTLQTSSTSGNLLTPPGIITQDGGNISIFTNTDVNIGISRIFTLRGGNEIIWSTKGNIAAGSSAKTVQSAPPTRVLIDPQSANVKVDLAGLATGGGIGVLATVTGVTAGNVDLIAPTGTVDAGDAGIRATGNLNISAVAVLNASNIQVGGTSTGVPAASTVAVPNISALTAAGNAGGAANSAANEVSRQKHSSDSQEETPSIITVEVVGYGGSDDAGGG
jgi:hypothetical protein